MNNNLFNVMTGVLFSIMVLLIGIGYLMGAIITKTHYEDVITKLELQFQMSIDR